MLIEIVWFFEMKTTFFGHGRLHAKPRWVSDAEYGHLDLGFIDGGMHHVIRFALSHWLYPKKISQLVPTKLVEFVNSFKLNFVKFKFIVLHG